MVEAYWASPGGVCPLRNARRQRRCNPRHVPTGPRFIGFWAIDAPSSGRARLPCVDPTMGRAHYAEIEQPCLWRKTSYRPVGAGIRWCGLLRFEQHILETLGPRAMPESGEFRWPLLRLYVDRILTR